MAPTPIITPAFDDPLSPEALYWLGWLTTDGCVSPPVISLKLAPKDRHIVEAFHHFVGCGSVAEYPSRISNGRNGETITSSGSVEWQVGRKYLVDRLGHLGIVPKKTTILEVPAQLATSPEFWCGAIEGDGCIAVSTTKKSYGSYGYLNVNLVSSSHIFLNQFSRFTESLGFTFSTSEKTYSKLRTTPSFVAQLIGEQAVLFAKRLLSVTKFQPLLRRKWDAVPGDEWESRASRNDRIVALRKSGLKIDEVAAKVNLSRTQVKAVLREAQV
jgi:hypothetical protein